ncbi:MAG: hypothetical protein ACLQMF_09700 [Rectinemataceae bacterium]
MEKQLLSYTVDLDFEAIKLPPVSDILVLGKKVPQGKLGILHSFELILPDVFSLFEVDDAAFPHIDAIIVNKAILAKIPMQEIVKILKDHVFPYVSRGETIKVNFNVRIYQKNIKGEIVCEDSRAD